MTDTAAPVLRGVDGSPANDAAVGFAFEEASLRGVSLIALHAWTHPVSTGPGDMLPLIHDPAEIEAEETGLLAEALAGWHGEYRDVSVRRELLHASPRKPSSKPPGGHSSSWSAPAGTAASPACFSARSAKPFPTTPPARVAIVPHGRGQPVGG